MIYLANRGLKFVVNANRVRIVNIYLAVFDLVFVLDPSSKSTSAQNESCSSYFPLQLLFWPNFKLLYEIWTFNWSNSSQIDSNELTVSSSVSTVRAHAGIWSSVSDATRRDRRRSSSSARRSYPRGRPRSFPSRPLPSLPRARASRARRRPPSRPFLTTLLEPFASRAP